MFAKRGVTASFPLNSADIQNYIFQDGSLRSSPSFKKNVSTSFSKLANNALLNLITEIVLFQKLWFWSYNSINNFSNRVLSAVTEHVK